MASGSNIVRGSFIGEGAADVEIRTLSFRPRSIRLYNEGGLASAVWLEGMTDGTGLKTITAGTMSSMVTGITPLSDGFRLGQDADMNAAGEKVFYEVSD